MLDASRGDDLQVLRQLVFTSPSVKILRYIFCTCTRIYEVSTFVPPRSKREMYEYGVHGVHGDFNIRRELLANDLKDIAADGLHENDLPRCLTT